MKRPFTSAVVSCLAAGALAGAAMAKFAAPQPLPVARLLKNAEAYRAAHPGEADAHYTLARIHYLAFSRGTAEVPALQEANAAGKPELAGNWLLDFELYEARQRRARELALQDLGERGPGVPAERASTFDEARGKRARQLESQNWRPRGDLPVEELFAHVTAALAGFREAARLEPANGLHRLGLASLAEEFGDWAKARKDVPAELRSLNQTTARAAYLQAFRLAIGGEASLPELPVSGLASMVSHEAGHAFMRLAERERRALSATEQAAVQEVKSGLAKLKGIRVGAITPIVFALHPVPHLDALLAPERHVDFDLRGYGPSERWPWVRPGTGLLVWDPQARGAVDSARQLFGSYTFELFHRTGYDALALLDDNGDGELRAGEWQGIRAWFDGDSDGRCTPEEMRDLETLGIAAIATRAVSQEGPHPMHPRGLTLRDGRTLPTWDWLVEPVPR